MNNFKRHLTPSLVLSLIALCFSLSGVSYAAVQLQKNSISAKYLRSGSVTSAKIRDGSIAAQDLSPDLFRRLASTASQASTPGAPTGAPAPSSSPQPESKWHVRSLAIVNSYVAGDALKASLDSRSDSDWRNVSSPQSGVYCLTPERPLREELLNDKGEPKRPVMVWNYNSTANGLISVYGDPAPGGSVRLSLSPASRVCTTDTLEVRTFVSGSRMLTPTALDFGVLVL